MQRVMIIGQPGSGKSTLARKLGEATGLPVVYMDHIHWKPGWIPRDDAEKIDMVRAEIAKDAWIIEGGFSRTYPERAARADTLIWLDVGVVRRIWRVTYRAIRDYGKTRPDMAEDCPEGNPREMWIFLKFIWRTRRSSRVRLRTLVEAQTGQLEVFTFSDITEVNAFVESVRARAARS